MEALAGDHAWLERFIGSFTTTSRPDVTMFTGGEPLLHPKLLSGLSATASEAGSSTAVLTGGFFARGGVIASRILSALLGLDHISFSVDAFHEREVHRADIFAALSVLLDHGKDVSLHIVGQGPSDPYLANVTADTRRRFGRQVPMLVSRLRAAGRASAWAGARIDPTEDDHPMPCAMAAWPVITFDGVITACCEQKVVDQRPVPAHLAVGRADTDSWADVRDRMLSSPMLRMIRAVGPAYLQSRLDGPGGSREPGYCAGCRRLSGRAGLEEKVHRVAAGQGGMLLDREVARMERDAGAVALVRRYGIAAYADMVAPG
jgi:hypothetical protein